MENDKKINVLSDIKPEEYKPKKYYNIKKRNKILSEYADSTFENMRSNLQNDCNRYMPMMLIPYTSPLFLRKKKIKECAKCLSPLIKNNWYAQDSYSNADDKFIACLIELSLDYSSLSFTENNMPVQATKTITKAYAGLTKFSKQAFQTITAPLNIWEQKQLIYGMYCAIAIYLINSRIFQEEYIVSANEGFTAYKKAIASGNKDLITYSIGKVAADMYKIVDTGLFND